MPDLRRGYPGNYGFSSDSVVRARRTAQNYQNYGGGIEFRARSEEEEEEEESGPPSPTLWKTSPARIPEAEVSLLHHRSLSPASRRHAIARSRREIMEMVRNMPETSYELSLQDLVEHQPYVQASVDNKNSKDTKRQQSEKAKRKKSQERNKGPMSRSVSMETEPVLLKMFSPVSLGLKKKSISMGRTKTPPCRSPSLVAQEKDVDKEWWKRRYSFAGDSDTTGVTISNNNGSTGSSSSGSSSRRSKICRKIGGLANCLSCFQTPKTKPYD